MKVGNTISHAWKFSGRRAVPLLGLGWLTATFYGAAAAYFLSKMSGTMLVWPRPDAGSFNNFALFYLFCLVVLTALANAVMGSAMTREAMEPGAEWKTAFFSIARREWGLFANLLLLYVVVIGLTAAIIFAGEVGAAVSLPMVGNGGVWKGIALAPVMRTTFAALAILVGLFLATRFGFFLAAIAVADPPARLLQAWISSRGNFLRLLTVSLGILLPVLVVALLAVWAVVGLQFLDAIAALFGPSHDNTQLFHAVRDNSGAIAAIFAVALLIWNALFAGASAEAYGRVEHKEESSAAFAPFTEPAIAIAAASPNVAVVEARRIEPAFVAAEESKLVAKALETKPEDAKPEELKASHSEAEEHVAEVVEPAESGATTEAKAASTRSKPEEIELKTVEDHPIPAEPEAKSEKAASADSHEEALAPQEPLPAMDPMGHAAPAAPNPSDAAPATPLPSFVKTQPSQEREPSEAA